MNLTNYNLIVFNFSLLTLQDEVQVLAGLQARLQCGVPGHKKNGGEWKCVRCLSTNENKERKIDKFLAHKVFRGSGALSC
jgi:hypothetical protein